MEINYCDQQSLLQIAKQSIFNGLKSGCAIVPDSKAYSIQLQAHISTFVTLNINASLRGCVGSLNASKPLVNDVAEHAYAAAFLDSRFPPLNNKEFDILEYHISILAPPQELQVESEEALLHRLRPGVDGVVLAEGSMRSTFLPAVWKKIPDPAQFIRQLKIKGGFPVTYWSDKIKVETYTVFEFSSA